MAYEDLDYTNLDLNKKYDIEEIAEFIRNKVYGIDVRESIALAIEWVAETYDLTVIEYKDLVDKTLISNDMTQKEFEESKNKVSNLENIVDDLNKRYENQIANDSSLDEVVDARTNAMSKTFPTLKARLDGNEKNPSFKNDVPQTISTGSELVNPANAVLGTGWTRSGDQFTHRTGYQSNLTIPIAGLSSANQYEINITVTNPASGSGGQSDFWLSLGGTREFETYNGGGTSYKYVMYADDVHDNLIIRPWKGYAGTLTVSVKQVTGKQLAPFIGLLDTNGRLASEVRVPNQGTDSLYIGYNSGRWSPDGYRNTHVGNISGSRMTTGFWNTGLGYGTLQENTVGTRNVALGYIALRNNVSGDRNIAVGSFAMTNLETGRNNIAIGVDSYYHATEGDGNIAIGLLALATNPHSNFNIAIGNHSMSGSNGGSGNIGLGNDTLRYNRGLGNVALGDKALSSNSSGSFNVGVGINSLRYGKTGTYNIGLGENSGMYMEGTENVAIGRRSAVYLGEGTKDNIALGSLSLGQATGGTENIAIGSSAMGRNSVDVGRKNIAIGTNALRWADGAEGNVALGDQALSLNQSGRRNIGIGQDAGYDITTGYDNILIGAFTEVKSPTANKQLNIGNAITSDNYETGTIDFRKIKLTDLPTTKPAEAGTVWNDNGTLKIA